MHEEPQICDLNEELHLLDEASLKLFEQGNRLQLPSVLRRILLQTNGGFVREEFLKFDPEDPDLLIGVEEIFGITDDPEKWTSSIVPLPRWVNFKNEIYGSFPTVNCIEEINGDVSRFFVFSGDGVVFHLLDYSDSNTSKGVAYLDLVGGDQTIENLGDNLSCVIEV